MRDEMSQGIWRVGTSNIEHRTLNVEPVESSGRRSEASVFTWLRRDELAGREILKADGRFERTHPAAPKFPASCRAPLESG
jgi:hypothetical protein